MTTLTLVLKTVMAINQQTLSDQNHFSGIYIYQLDYNIFMNTGYVGY